MGRANLKELNLSVEKVSLSGNHSVFAGGPGGTSESFSQSFCTCVCLPIHGGNVEVTDQIFCFCVCAPKP